VALRRHKPEIGLENGNFLKEYRIEVMVNSKSDLPRVSMITGFYNRGHLLTRTVDSMLAQRYPNIELIVFDDCSTDETQDRLNEYEARNDARLRIIRHKSNVGFTKGMINAIESSTGEIIAVQGSGDSSDPDRIMKQVQLLLERPAVGVVGCHYENIVESTGLARLRTPNADAVDFAALVKGNVFTHGEVCFRRSTYAAAGGYRKEFRYCQDYDLWLRCIKVAQFATVPQMLYRRYVQFDGVSYAPHKAVIQARYFLICQKLASSTEDEALALLKRLADHGPESVVGPYDAALQKRIMRNSLRQVVWGNAGQAQQLARSLELKRRMLVGITARTLGLPIMKWPRSMILRVLGIREE
jgi:hypothetical protein